MLSAATNAKRSSETGDLSLQVEMVAGARNQQYLAFAWASRARLAEANLVSGHGGDAQTRLAVLGKLDTTAFFATNECGCD
jgi:hypothetical protein